MSEQASVNEQLNILDRVILSGDTNSPEIALQRAGFLGVTLPAMIGAGYGTYYGIHNTIFADHEQYDTAQSTINEASYTLSSLESSVSILRQNGIEVGDESSVVKAQEAQITQAEKSMPEHYNPSVDGLVSLGLGIVAAGTAFAFTTKRFLKAYRKSSRISKSQAQQV